MGRRIKHASPASLFVVSDFVDGRLWLWPDRLRFVVERVPRGTTGLRHGGSTYTLEIDSEGDRWRAQARWCEYAKTMPVAAREDLVHAIAEACGVSIPASPPPGVSAHDLGAAPHARCPGIRRGAHTRTHPILSRGSRSQLDQEILECKEQIGDKLGLRGIQFAYPNCRSEDYTPDAVRAVALACYLAAVTTVSGANTPDTPVPELRRIDERTEDLPHFAQSVSGFDLLKGRFRRASDGISF